MTTIEQQREASSQLIVAQAIKEASITESLKEVEVQLSALEIQQQTLNQEKMLYEKQANDFKIALTKEQEGTSRLKLQLHVGQSVLPTSVETLPTVIPAPIFHPLESRVLELEALVQAQQQRIHELGSQTMITAVPSTEPFPSVANDHVQILQEKYQTAKQLYDLMRVFYFDLGKACFHPT